MRRLAILLALVGTLAFAGPASANHEIYKATFDKPGMHGTVTLSFNADHSAGRIAWALDNIRDGKSVIDVNGGTCGDFAGNVMIVYTREHREYVNGDWTGSIRLPDGVARAFKHDFEKHGGMTATLRNDGRSECDRFAKTHP